MFVRVPLLSDLLGSSVQSIAESHSSEYNAVQCVSFTRSRCLNAPTKSAPEQKRSANFFKVSRPNS